MPNETVVYLNTPLIEHSSGSDREPIHVIRGKLIGESPVGLMIQVKSVGNGKEFSAPPPFRKILIPSHKIDFVLIE